MGGRSAGSGEGRSRLRPAGRRGMLHGMTTDTMNPATAAVTWGPFIQAAYEQFVTAGYAINSLGKAHWSLGCAHALNTYLHVLSPATVPLDPACKPAS
jgi:hypothetical protein